MSEEQERQQSLFEKSPMLERMVSIVKGEGLNELNPREIGTFTSIVKKPGPMGLQQLASVFVNGEPTIRKVLGSNDPEGGLIMAVFLITVGFELGDNNLVEEARNSVQALWLTEEGDDVTKEEEAKALDMLLRAGVFIKGMRNKGEWTPLDLMDITIAAFGDEEKARKYAQWRQDRG